MSNIFIHPLQAPSLSELLSQQLRKIDTLVNNLKPKDVLQDDIFENTVARIKSQILPAPVEVGEPKHVDYEYHERKLTIEQLMWHPTGNGNFYRHEIKFPFTGNGELFYHTSSGFSFSSSDHGMIKPLGNFLTVFVDTPTLDPNIAIIEARKLLDLTFTIGQRSNVELRAWLPGVEARIDQQLNDKREELKNFFG